MDEDPGEEHDLAPRRRAEVERQMEQLVAAAERAREGAVEARQVDLDAESAARLRAIGYLNDGEEEAPEE